MVHVEKAAALGLKSAQAEMARYEARPHLPDAVSHIWMWWVEIAMARQHNGWAPLRLSWSDIMQWASLMRHTLLPSEVRAIIDIDRLWYDDYLRRKKIETKT